MKQDTFEKFIVADSNRLAKTACMVVAENPGKVHNPLYIYGESGLGKTHLLHAIETELKKNKRVRYVTTDELIKDKLEMNKDAFVTKYTYIDALLIDDTGFLKNAINIPDEIIDIFNQLIESEKQIVISSNCNSIDLLEEKLKTLLQSGLEVEIKRVEHELCYQIAKQKIEGTIIENKIEEDAIRYIIDNSNQNLKTLEKILNRIIANTAILIPEKIDLSFTKEALKDFIEN